jgi:hypothetical protein
LFIIACALAALFTVLFLCVMPFNRAMVVRRDFVTYWATGQQLVHHGNPYDPGAITRIEQDAGFKSPTSYYMRNAPWALPLALPLGYLGVQAASFLWSLLMLGLLIASIRLLRTAIGFTGARLDWLGLCFPPALFCIILGQTSMFMLAGLALFLRFYKTRPFAAGAALWFCSLKPHLFLPFGLVLIIWMFVSRSYRILLGALSATAGGAILTMLIDPSAWGQYAYYMRTSQIAHEFTPCLGDLLRDSVNPSAEWLAFVPAILGSVWALAYFWPRRTTWDWFENGNPLMLVSLIVAPFGWIFDQSLAIPALLFALFHKPSRLLLTILALVYLLLEIQVVSPFGLHSPAYLWTAPFWLVWYLMARRSTKVEGAITAPAMVRS